LEEKTETVIDEKLFVKYGISSEVFIQGCTLPRVIHLSSRTLGERLQN